MPRQDCGDGWRQLWAPLLLGPSWKGTQASCCDAGSTGSRRPVRCWHGGLGPGVRRPILLGQCCVRGVGCSELALLQPINVVAELERGAQLQPHVLHHHVTAQQQQGLAIDLLWAGRRCQQPDCIPTQGFPTSGPAVTFRSPESLPCPMSLQQLTSYWKAPQPFLH